MSAVVNNQIFYFVP